MSKEKDRRRAEAELRQIKYDSLSLTEKLAQAGKKVAAKLAKKTQA